MEDFYDPMSPEELEAVREISDAPTLIFMFIMAVIFIVSMLLQSNNRNGF